MTQHASFALAPEFLDIVLIDDSKPMQGILRSIVGGLRPQRIRTFDRADEALEAMLHELPNFIITDWRMDPMSGATFLKTIRDKRMAPLSFVPVIVVTAHATRQVVERAMEAGAHHVLVKPLAPSVLIDRLYALLNDSRPFILNETGQAYEIEGVRKILSHQNARTNALLRAKHFHDLAKHAQDGDAPARPIDTLTADIARRMVGGSDPKSAASGGPGFFASPRRTQG